MSDQAGMVEAKPARFGVWIALFLVIAFAFAIRFRLREMPLERDEGEYAYAGQLILKGVPPYREAYNMKFPGVYAMYAILMSVLGQSPAGIHVGTAIANSTTIALIFLIVRRLFDDYAAIISAAAYALLSVEQGSLGMMGHATHFVALFACAGILLLLIALERDRPWLIFLAGMMLGLSILMKQPGLFFALFGGAWILIHHALNRPIRFRKLIAHEAMLALGGAMPLVATGLILWKCGVFGKAWFWTVVYARAYGSEIPLSHAPREMVAGFLDLMHFTIVPWSFAAIAAIIVCCYRARRRQMGFVLAWLAFAFLATSVGFYYRPHYFILMMPPAALLTGAGLSLIRSRLAARKWKDPWLMPTGAFLLAFGWMVLLERDFFFEMSPAQACRACYGPNLFVESPVVARYLAAHTAPDERIAVIGSEPQILFYANRPSATGYMYTYGLTEIHAHARQMQQEMAAEIEFARPRYIVFVDSDSSWMVRDRSDPWFVNWYRSYRSDFDVVGYAEVAESGSVYRFDENAKGNPPTSGSFLVVLKRRGG